MTLAPREVAPLHFHTLVDEHIVCLDGQISVAVNGTETETVLSEGQSLVIRAGTPHRIWNGCNAPTQYLLTQSGGKYDFCLADS
ncbi:MAG: cupin domain-containing protein [Hydrogenophilales bacterium]|nr:cupin domain-containing protein [Hydrogenophilales bacterium]